MFFKNSYHVVKIQLTVQSVLVSEEGRLACMSHLCLWSQHNLELADNLNECHLCLQQSKSHSNAVSWTIAKGHVSTRMTLSLLLGREPLEFEQNETE